MHHELMAMERQGMRERIKELETMFETMQEDFAACAKGVSPCFFCANDDICVRSNDKNCNFVWEKHD